MMNSRALKMKLIEPPPISEVVYRGLEALLVEGKSRLKRQWRTYSLKKLKSRLERRVQPRAR